MKTHPLVIDLAGKLFGRLTAISYAPEAVNMKAWNCLCSCGSSCLVRGANLRNGNTTSCGCLIREKLAAGLFRRHGLADTRGAYTSWSALNERCNNPKNPSWMRYGGRGISVCERWSLFENFLADMGQPEPGQSIDRFPDNDGNYEPGNCRWATMREQGNNRSNSRRISYQGVEYNARDLSEKLECNYHSLRQAVFKSGLTVEEFLSKPPSFRLTVEIEAEIKRRIQLGEFQRSIAEVLGCSQSLITAVNVGRLSATPKLKQPRALRSSLASLLLA